LSSDSWWKSLSFLLLLLLLAFGICARPSGWKGFDSEPVSRRLLLKAAWKSELEKRYPFVVGEVPELVWDDSDETFCESVRLSVAREVPLIV